MKAIYTRVGNHVYKIVQSTLVPANLVIKGPGASSNLEFNNTNKQVTQNVYINNLQIPGTKSNAELVRELKDFLKEKGITEIKPIQNYFKVLIDYSAYEDGKEIEHSSVVRPVKAEDKVILLGVATNDELVYRRVKNFKGGVDFRLKSALPHGIMETPKKNYVLKVNNICLFQDFNAEKEIHKSCYENAYNVNATLIQHSLDDMKMVYSTEGEGIELQAIVSNYIPRCLSINLDIVLADYIVVYNDEEINKILIDNIEHKYHPEDHEPVVPSGDDDPPILIPDHIDPHERADGRYCPDRDGYFSYYERCTERTPHALLVVENAISDGYYDTTKMIKKRMVIRDIPDIEVGDYVIFREAYRDTYDPHRPPVPPPPPYPYPPYIPYPPYPYPPMPPYDKDPNGNDDGEQGNPDLNPVTPGDNTDPVDPDPGTSGDDNTDNPNP